MQRPSRTFAARVIDGSADFMWRFGHCLVIERYEMTYLVAASWKMDAELAKATYRGKAD